MYQVVRSVRALPCALVVLAACSGDGGPDFGNRELAQQWVARVEAAGAHHPTVDGALGVAEDGWVCDNDEEAFEGFVRADPGATDNLIGALAFIDTYCPDKVDPYLNALAREGGEGPLTLVLEARAAWRDSP